METESPARPGGHVHGYWRRHAAALARWLHIYLSMVSFAILLFFAVTGLTLNHAEWFTAGHEQTRHCQGTLTPEWVKAPDDKVAKLEIAEFLRRSHSIRGTVGDFLIDESQCAISFKGPGYAADAFIDRATGGYELTETRLGLAAVANDLHKGRDSGPAWSLLIDVSAVLMTVVSLSGLVLLWFFRRRRAGGFAVAIVGGAVCYLIYRLLVP